MSGTAARARTLLARPGAWLSARGDAYQLRQAPDRRSRVVLTLNEAEFRALVEQPGLRARAQGGWEARPTAREAAVSGTANDGAGRPGVLPGTRPVVEADGRVTLRRANLGESPIAWLARRRDADGRPFLSPAEAAAGERLRLEAERAAAGPSVTMRWDALPRAGGGSATRVEPGDAALSAGRRVARALATLEPNHRRIVEAICIRGDSLTLAERSCGLARRSGREALKAGLAGLARCYGIG